MKQKQIIIGLLIFFVLAVIGVIGGSFYMLDYSLSPDNNRQDKDSMLTILYERVPDMKPWMDSIQRQHLLCDTFIKMSDGRQAHAIYLKNDSAHGHTAIVVHGYKDTAIKFLYLGRMYYRDLSYNVLMPDLSAHGQSDGEIIQMGWKDRLDVIRWTEVARKLFQTENDSVKMVIHGVSMGAATTMCVSGEALPSDIKCFVEDCGYTSVWDEFSNQLHEQFSLPNFPLMYTTSLLCHLQYGWSFGKASPLQQVALCHRPMLFIHGSNDTFVPTAMVYKLYKAKPQPKELWIAPGSEHARSYLDHPKDYLYHVQRFLNFAKF